MGNYLYTCYCGPARLKDDVYNSRAPIIYDNCPRIGAPVIEPPDLYKIKDRRMTIFLSNIDEILNYIIIKLEAKKIKMVGSFTRNQQTAQSDVDLVVDMPIKKESEIRHICYELSKKYGIPIDIMSERVSNQSVHNVISKGDAVLLMHPRQLF